MTQENMRLALLDSTVRVIARNGLDGATTKAIATQAGLNEAYIYRVFGGKEDLFYKTFITVDEEMICELLRHIPVMYMEEMEFKDRCSALFLSIWNYFIGNRDKCMCFIRYYYSAYFSKEKAQAHFERCHELIKQFSAAFRDDADVWMILNYVLNVMLDFAVMVFNGEIENNEKSAHNAFNLVYSSVQQYFK